MSGGRVLAFDLDRSAAPWPVRIIDPIPPEGSGKGQGIEGLEAVGSFHGHECPRVVVRVEVGIGRPGLDGDPGGNPNKGGSAYLISPRERPIGLPLVCGRGLIAEAVEPMYLGSGGRAPEMAQDRLAIDRELQVQVGPKSLRLATEPQGDSLAVLVRVMAEAVPGPHHRATQEKASVPSKPQVGKENRSRPPIPGSCPVCVVIFVVWVRIGGFVDFRGRSGFEQVVTSVVEEPDAPSLTSSLPRKGCRLPLHR